MLVLDLTQWRIMVGINSTAPSLVSWIYSYVRLGIIPHDGKNIPFKELSTKVIATYNTAPSLTFSILDFPAKMLGKNFKTDSFDLADLNLHSGESIEHDASLIRTYPLLFLPVPCPHRISNRS